MKFSVTQSELVELLNKTQNIVEKRNTMPILGNVLLECTNNELKVFATDLEVSLTDTVKISGGEAGKIAVDAKNILNLIREMPEGLIHFSKKSNNWLEIKINKSRYNIVGLSPEEYPIFPTIQGTKFTTIQSEVLLDMINKTIYSVSNDETRYHLNGVYFEQIKKDDSIQLRMVATDGHRLSVVERKTQIENQLSLNAGVIVPRKGLNEIRKILETVEGSVEIAFEGAQIIVRNKATTIMVRLIEGKYPNYQQLIPQTLKKKVSIPKEIFASALRRVSLLSNQKSKGVTLNLAEGMLEISSNNPELGEGKDELEIKYQGENLKIGFNARYLLDILNSIEDESVEFSLNDQLSPGLIRPDSDKGYTCIVMPMRI